ncbi:MAG: glucose-1-phosphate cytidylyltransferase [Cyclobacteriaceae bacterium]
MQVVIFAGGLGSRISEESHLRPKPMIEIGGKPLLWHIMKIYQAQGFNEFIICLGYKGYMIKEYFINYFVHNSDVTVDLNNNSLKVHQSNTEDFVVTLVETGQETKTAGRLKRVASYIKEDVFMLTYGDGVANVDLKELIAYHKRHGRIGTVTMIQPKGKFGVIQTSEKGEVAGFVEKPQDGGNWINGGYFVLQKEVFSYLEESMDEVMWEQDPMLHMVEDGQLMGYKHHGFWKSMDILRDKVELENLWQSNSPPWKIWKS